MEEEEDVQELATNLLEDEGGTQGASNDEVGSSKLTSDDVTKVAKILSTALNGQHWAQQVVPMEALFTLSQSPSPAVRNAVAQQVPLLLRVMKEGSTELQRLSLNCLRNILPIVPAPQFRECGGIESLASVLRTQTAEEITVPSLVILGSLCKRNTENAQLFLKAPDAVRDLSRVLGR